tara:strand:- start:185 stop:1126 length:942 start_codon:yes stop_codon:yes gene_type:complete
MRYTLFPIEPKYQNLWELYKKHQRCYWVAEEIDYTADQNDWQNLTTEERHFIEHVLAFFAGSDGIVMENLIQNFCCDVDIMEVQVYYGFQAMIENVHAETYSRLIDAFVKDPHRKDFLFKGIESIPCIATKARWAIEWMDNSRPFLERLVAFAVVEGIFFSGSFCSVFWLKSRGKMVRTLGTSNELIARDEGLHCEFAVALFHALVADGETRPDTMTIHEIVNEAIEIEQEFICDALPCRLIGMNADLMKQYVEFVGDRLLQQLDYPKLTDSTNPFGFMEMISMDGKTNFFEKRVTEYQMTAGEAKFDNTVEF